MSTLKTQAAVLWKAGEDWSVREIDLDAPRSGEVLVRLAASGICHSDEHLVTGDLPVALPIIGGHEGAGTVETVGPGVTSVVPGDHVVFSFVPACGVCPSCSSGHQSRCDLGRFFPEGLQVSDQTSRHHADGTDLRLMCLLGAFARHTVVAEASVVKVDPSLPLDKVCLLGCGVATGWGSSVYAAGVRAGETAVIIGLGGVGSSAVQGARLAGAELIIGIDPIEWKREKAKGFGATHTAASIDEALELVRELTWGRMAERVVMAMGVGDGRLIGPAMGLAAKGGRVVVTNIHPHVESQISINMGEVTLLEKQLVGALFGSANPRVDIPRLARLYQAGLVDLDGLVTRTYTLEQVNEGFDDLRNGRVLRGVIRFE
ncbi:MAG TPA: NDMA-dependent alcohol dehydrogenase [Acidimicrobiales bacterium]|nr:NDMA-dependent alcohol dehydrogenase [Acidimicrobiales bacterium]